MSADDGETETNAFDAAIGTEDPLVAVHHNQVDDVVEALQCPLNAAATVTTKQQVTHDPIANLDWQILFPDGALHANKSKILLWPN